ncbi:MAG TPA: DmsE family decaheme c-type cytochrome [Terriglobales bacterium]|nr:DmsE family decaheme c-type cytochrome [Terriglobales bacterium]
MLTRLKGSPFQISLVLAIPLLLAVSYYGETATAAGSSQQPPSSSAAPSPAQPAQSQVSGGGATTASYVGSQACQGCHQAAAHSFSDTMMGNIMIKHPRDSAEEHGCESCHGPGSLYVPKMAASMGKGMTPDQVMHGPPIDPSLTTFRTDSDESVKQQNAPCLGCHQRGDQAFWQASTHAFRGVKCVDCHEIMRKTSDFQLAAEFRANPFVYTRPETQVCIRCHLDKQNQMNMPSHMPLREGLMVCTDCHNPHGGPYQAQLVQPTVNEVCYTCHAEKRGPVLWVHPPVQQNCSNCHDPHGSTNRFLLKVSPPRLCQQCHVGTFHPGSPGAAGSVFVFGHSCTNCHANIHGSNSPGGVFLTR